MAASSSSNLNLSLQLDEVREQNHYMPIANVIRIMRRILPPHAKISYDAKESIQECVSEYISFITSEAIDHCQSEQRRTVTAEDILWAMGKLGFDDYVTPLSRYLQRYRQTEGEHALRHNVPVAAATATYGMMHSLWLPPPPPLQVNSAYGSASFHAAGLFDASANNASDIGGFCRDDGSAFDPFPRIKRD